MAATAAALVFVPARAGATVPRHPAGYDAVSIRPTTPRGRLLVTPPSVTTAAGSVGAGDALAVAQQPVAVAADGSDALIGDGQYSVVRMLGAGDTETDVAGDGTTSIGGDGGPSVDATLDGPDGLAVDGRGNVIISDFVNNRVRVAAAATGTFFGVAMTAGDIYTVAGDGTFGFGGDGGPATAAQVAGPAGIAVDQHGNIVFADTANNRIRVVAGSSGTFYGMAMTAGDIYTVAGDGTAGFGGDGGPATAATLGAPQGVAVDASGNLVLADSTNNRVRVVAAASGTFYGVAMTAGDIYTVAGDGTAGSAGDGGPATAAELDDPVGVAVLSGDVLVADSGDNRLRLVAPTAGTPFGLAVGAGDIETVAGDGGVGFYSGDGGPAPDAELLRPAGTAADPGSDLVIADSGNNRIRLVAASDRSVFGQDVLAGDIYTVAGDGVAGFAGDGGPAVDAELSGPAAVATDAAGNILVSDFFNDRIRLVAARSGTFYGIDAVAGDIYTVAGDGVFGYSGDGGPARAAEIDGPEGIAVDPAGNLLFADFYNDRIRVVAAENGQFYGIDMTAGDIYTVAGDGTEGYGGDGGPATAAELDLPDGVAVTWRGDIAIADSGTDRIRLVAGETRTAFGTALQAGDIYTVAGNGLPGSGGNGGPATTASLDEPDGLAFDVGGNIVEADAGSGTIRLVAAHPGDYDGQSVVAGDIYGIVGGGSASCQSAASAPDVGLSVPVGVTLRTPDSLEVSDLAGGCVRHVVPAPGPPEPPATVTATAGSASATVSWSASPYDGGSAITGYTVTSVPAGASATVGSSVSGVTLQGLHDGATYRFFVVTNSVASGSEPSALSNPVVPEPAQGYWMATSSGTVGLAGAGGLQGSKPSTPPAGPVVGMAPSPDGAGYALVTDEGEVLPFGDFEFHGDLPSLGVSTRDIVGMAMTPDGGGYWLVGADGGVFGFGDAAFSGSLPSLGVHVHDIVGIAASSPADHAYWLVGSDGGVFAFGGAPFEGSLPSSGVHVRDVRGIAGAPSGGPWTGYVLVGADGGVFSFGPGAPYDGSLPGLHVAVSDVVGLALSPGASGYWEAASNGAVYAFGAAHALGTPAAVEDQHTVAIAATAG